MRSLSSALAAALGAPVQQPAILVLAGFSPVRRWSSFATLTWAGQSWAREDVALQDLQVDGLSLSGTLVLGNADDMAGALVLEQSPTDVPFTIWGFDAAATAPGDVVHLCDAVGAGASIGPRQVTIGLRSRAELLTSPRTWVGPAAGFQTLLPAGTVLRINGQDYRLDRRR